MSQKKKKLIMRIIVIVLAVLMFAGVAFGSVAYIFAEDTVVVESFEKGNFSSAFNTAKGDTDQNNVKSLIVKSGEFSISDLSSLQNLSSCKVIDLGGATVEGGIFPDSIMSGRSVSRFVLPSNVTSIGSSTFSGCGSLSEITLPSTVTSIGNRAFEGCTSLKSITIPSSVTSIDECAFRGSGLEIIYFSGNAPSLSSESIPTSVKITVSSNATGFDSDAWSAYSVEKTGTAVQVTTNGGETAIAIDTDAPSDTTVPVETPEALVGGETVTAPAETSVSKQAASSTMTFSNVVVLVVAGAVILVIVIAAAAIIAMKLVSAKEEEEEGKPEKMVETIDVEVVSSDISEEK